MLAETGGSCDCRKLKQTVESCGCQELGTGQDERIEKLKKREDGKAYGAFSDGTGEPFKE